MHPEKTMAGDLRSSRNPPGGDDCSVGDPQLGEPRFETRQQQVIPESEVLLLYRISTIVSSKRSLDEMLGEVIGFTIQATACDACLVYLLDRATNELVLRASQVPHAAALGNLRMKMGQGVTGWVAQHQSIVALSSNASADSRFKPFRDLVEDTYQAFLSVPLVSGGDLVGVINVHHHDAYTHTGLEISRLRFVGEQLGVAVARSLLEEKNRRLLEETLEAKRALEARKVVERAKGILQRKLGLSEEEAYQRLKAHSRDRHVSIKDIAKAIILSEELSRQR
jgi:signal transduction protein with GAF and PtsI domain